MEAALLSPLRPSYSHNGVAAVKTQKFKTKLTPPSGVYFGPIISRQNIVNDSFFALSFSLENLIRLFLFFSPLSSSRRWRVSEDKTLIAHLK